MNASRIGIALIVDAGQYLLGTITDGDLRRAILDNEDLDQPVSRHLDQKAGSLYAKPISAPVDADPADYLSLFQKHNVRHLPLLDSDGRVVGLAIPEDFLPIEVMPLQAVIMAGGSGTRLRPLTEEIPKPMLPVGARPLMEIIVDQLRDAGIQRVNIATHYNEEKITEHFGDGANFGIELAYVSEERPLGTAGALGLMDTPVETTLVVNGDVLTQVNYQAMLGFHREHEADMTVGVRRYEIDVPYGVVESEKAFVRRFREKPMLDLFVNAGIYLLEPEVYTHIENGEHLDMTELMQRLLDANRPVCSFPIHEYWLDIGRPADYERAQEHIKDWNCD